MTRKRENTLLKEAQELQCHQNPSSPWFYMEPAGSMSLSTSQSCIQALWLVMTSECCRSSGKDHYSSSQNCDNTTDTNNNNNKQLIFTKYLLHVSHEMKPPFPIIHGPLTFTCRLGLAPVPSTCPKCWQECYENNCLII